MAPQKRKPGTALLRPQALTEDKQKIILQHLQDGHWLKTAVLASGISTVTYYYWKKRFDESDPSASHLVDFFNHVKVAEAQAQVVHLGRIRRGEQGWQASAWFLERRHAEQWGKKTVIQLRAAPGSPEVHGPQDLAHLSDDELAELERRASRG